MVSLVCLSLFIGCGRNGNPTTPGLDGAGIETDSADNLTTTGFAVDGENPLHVNDLGNGPEYVETEVMVVLYQPLSGSDIELSLNSYSLRLKKEIPCRWGTVYELVITNGTPVEEMVERLKADPLVRIAEPNYIYHFTEAPHFPDDPLWESDDPGFDPRDSIYEQYGPAKIGADIVWNEFKGPDDMVVAVIDSGIRFDHEDLHDIIWINEDEIPDNEIDDDENGYIDDWWGWDCSSDDNEPWDPGDDHGTRCSGTLAAIQDNNLGCTGVAPGVQVMALRITYEDDIYESAVLEALEYARVNGADICSMSFSGPDFSEIIDTQCSDMWDNGNGIFLFACSGNHGTSQVVYPAANDDVTCVGGTTPFTRYGVPIDEKRITKNEDSWWWGSAYGDWLTVMGYGANCVTTSGSASDAYHDGVNLGLVHGTSFACPAGAGVTALIRSRFPNETSQWCLDRLIDTSDDLDVPGFDNQTGYGRINALRAVYGSDRFADQEDAYGFVPLILPEVQVFDSIHMVDNNPHTDGEDKYRFTTVVSGVLQIECDIHTWGENLDIALYSDQEMIQQVAGSIGPNHFDSSRESISLFVSPGEEYFLKVFALEVGNSTTYGLRIFNGTNNLSITGESLAPEMIHHEGEDVPFLKLTLETAYQVTLDELIVSMHGTLPHDNWAMTRIFRDTNWDGILDGNDHLVLEKSPLGLNRVIMDSLGLTFSYDQPLVLFITADISETLDDALVSLGLESYKDVTTEENIEAPYTDFPIVSESLLVGTDNEPPEWVTTVGIQSLEPFYMFAKIGWNEAIDPVTPPVKYNVYYTDTLPFEIGNAVKVPDVPIESGTDTDYETTVWGLQNDGTELHFVLRAEDQVGNEDGNLEILSCTPLTGGDPTNPVILATYPPGNTRDLAFEGNILVVAGESSGMYVFDRSDPVLLDQIAVWDGYVISLAYDGSNAYVQTWYSGKGYFQAIDMTDPSNPVTADSFEFVPYPYITDGEWIYASGYTNYTWYDALVSVNVSDPYILSLEPLLYLPGIFPSPATRSDLAIYNDYIYLSFGSEGMLVLDCSDPGSPTLINSFGIEDPTGVLVEGDTLYIVGYEGELVMYDIGSNPTDPPLLGSSSDGPGTDLDYKYGHVVLLDHFAYISRWDYGIVVFDVSNPASIEYVGDVALTGIKGLATDGTVIYAASMYSGLIVLI